MTATAQPITDKTPVKMPISVLITLIFTLLGIGVGYGISQGKLSSQIHRIDERTVLMQKQLDAVQTQINNIAK